MMSSTDEQLFPVTDQYRCLPGKGFLFRAGPFLVSIVLALALYPLGNPVYGPYFYLALAILAAVGVGVVFVPWGRLPAFAEAVPPLAFLVAVAFLRHAHGVGQSGYAPLVLVPVVWVALYGRTFHLVLSVLGASLTLIMPVAVLGGPVTEWRRAALYTVVGAALGFTIQALVRSLKIEVQRRKTAERRLAEIHALDVSDDIVQSLVAAKLALEIGKTQLGETAIERALMLSKTIMSNLLMRDMTNPGG